MGEEQGMGNLPRRFLREFAHKIPVGVGSEIQTIP
jgi:hypothetical protein